ncbi:MAG: ribonuclease III [bacterium]
MEKLSKEDKKKLKILEKKLGVRFWKRELLKRALTHKSYANERKLDAACHNERLEFLGDAVLELVVSHTLMDLYPEAPEGELSKLRASMVNEKTLAALARSFDIGDMLFLGRGEEMGQGREKSSLLSDAYEAVLGAIYLDRGFKKAFKVVRKHAEILISKVTQEGFYKDYKTQLQETSQTLFKTVPRYRLVDEEGPDHDKTFKVNILINNEIYGVGSGKSKKDAEQNAAREALEALEKKAI